MTDNTLIVRKLTQDGTVGADCPTDIEVELTVGKSRARAWVYFGQDEEGRLAIRIKAPGERLTLRPEDCSGVLVSVEQLTDVHFESETYRRVLAEMEAAKPR